MANLRVIAADGEASVSPSLEDQLMSMVRKAIADNPICAVLLWETHHEREDGGLHILSTPDSGAVENGLVTLAFRHLMIGKEEDE